MGGWEKTAQHGPGKRIKKKKKEKEKITVIITTFPWVRVLIRTITWHLNEVTSGIAVTSNITDIYFIAEMISFKRCLPIHEWIAKVFSRIFGKVYPSASAESKTRTICRNVYEFCRPFPTNYVNWSNSFNIN